MANEILISLIVGLISGVIGSAIGAKVAIAVLQSQVSDIREEIRELRKVKHEQTNSLLKLDGRLSALEDRVDEFDRNS